MAETLTAPPLERPSQAPTSKRHGTLQSAVAPGGPKREAEPAGRLSLWATLLALAALIALIVAAPDLAALTLLGAVLAYLLSPIVNGLERRGMDRTLSAALMLVVLTAIGALAVSLALPQALDQLMSLQARWESGDLLRLVQEAEVALARQLEVVDPEDLGLVASIRDAMSPGSAPLVGYVPDA
ncbi:MAG: AI-2E family transporter, partial [Bacteroidota bacterium]